MTDPQRTHLVLPRIPWGWLAVAVAALAFVVATRAVLGPFLAGFVIAYLLDPMADRLERKGLPRWLATLLVLALFLAAIVGLVVATAPIVVHQFEALVANLPAIVDDVRPWLDRLGARVGPSASEPALTGDVAEKAIAWLTGALGTIIAGGFAFFNVAALAIIAPVVAFYLLRDWRDVTGRIAAWWPRRHDATIRRLLAESDEALSGFVRGQFLVCLCSAGIYMIGWGLIGLDYFVVLSLLAGALGFVPFIGAIVGVGLSLLVAIGQFGLDPAMLGLVFLVFVVAQLLEGSVLTPNLIGNRIGLHPVWVLFAVFAGGELMGIIGVFLAVPVAAVAGVVVRWLLTKYLASGVYGGGGRDAP